MRKTLNSIKNILSAMVLVGLVASLASGCGTPSVESQVARYKSAIDRLDLLSTKQPQFRMDIEKKKAEFAQEFSQVSAMTGEEGSKAIGALCRRIEAWESQLNPQQPVAAPSQPGGKLGPAQPGAPGVQPGVQPAAGKLGTPAPGAAPAGDSGFGGAAAPGTVPAPAPGTVPAPTQPTGGSGFGGAAPAPAPAPAPGTAPAPTQPAGGSGFGGQ